MKKMMNHCAYCNRCVSNPKKCSRCGSLYCNVDCQANDWDYHRKYCSSQKSFEENKKNVELAPKVDLTESKFSDFEIIQQIGEGNFTIIKKVQHIKSGRIFALKLIDRVKMSRMHKEGDVLAEKHSLVKLADSERIVKIFATFKEENLLYILQEFVHGKELWDHCQYFGLCSDLLARYYMFQILSGIKQMHNLKIVHRDVKPENLMVCNRGNNIKFVDLGSSKDLEHPEVRPPITPELKGRVYEHFVGTAQYMPPECANNKGSGPSCDIWSAGCVWYHLYAGWSPFPGATDYLIFQKTTKGDYIFPSNIPLEIRKEIEKMIQIDPAARPSVDDLLESKVFDSVRSRTIKPMLPLSEMALISLKEYYVKNAGVLRVRPENHTKALEEINSVLIKAESILPPKKLVPLKEYFQLFKLQLKSLLSEAEFDLSSS